MNDSEPKLEPLPYQVELRDYLKSQEREIWDWFASARAQADYTKSLRMDLLKATYRLDPVGHADIYRTVEDVKTRLQLDIPVTLYQAQNSAQANAALIFILGEGHIVISGPVLSLLNAEEIKAVIGHELAHYQLWKRDDGDFHIVDRLMQAVACDPRAGASHTQSARRYQLYTEIFADRGSLCATGDVDTVIAALVKIETGWSHVVATSYLRQAEEIFAKGNVATEGLSHPEAFIRARALALWRDQGEEATPKIGEMIEGADALDELDLIGQTRLTAATRKLLECFLRPKWFQTRAVLDHAKLFFDDFRPASGKDTISLDGLKFNDAKLREYFCYVLLDFVAADPELDDMPLAAALELCRELDLNGQFEKLVTKELKIKARSVKRIKEQAAELLSKAGVQGE